MNVWRYFFLLLFAGSIASAAIPHSNPRAISMAGAYAGIGLGVEAPLANLSLPTNFNLSVALFQMAGWGYNNSYSLAHYNRYNGAYLDATAKQDILNAIPGDGMDVNGRLEVQPFALAYGPFAFSVLVQAGARGWLDKEAVSLLLFGNKVDYLYDVRPADLDAAAISTYMVSYALPLPAPTESIQHLGIGFNIKYLYGHYSAQVVNSSMHAETTYGSASADGSTLLRTAEGGYGFGLDLGMTTTFLKRWRASLVLENVAGRMA
jgi:hypothetical protein